MDRISAILSFVPDDSTPVEIGADRAPIALSFARRTGRPCYASEVSKGPYSALVKSVAQSSMSEMVRTYMADGLADFPPDADTALICGMGGFTIGKILEGAGEIERLNLIVCEPQSHAEETRRALVREGFFPVREIYVSESGHIYPVIEARRSSGEKPLDEVEIMFGRYPVEHRDPLLIQMLLNRRRMADAIAKNASGRSKGLKVAIDRAIERMK